MDKTNRLLVASIMIAVFIIGALFFLMLLNPGSGSTSSESSNFPFPTFFVIFLLPIIIEARKRRKAQKEMDMKAQLEEWIENVN